VDIVNMSEKLLISNIGNFIDLYKSFILDIHEILPAEEYDEITNEDSVRDIDDNPIKYVTMYGTIFSKYDCQIEDESFYTSDVDDIFIMAIQDMWSMATTKQKIGIDGRINDMLDNYLEFHTAKKSIKSNIVDVVNEFNKSIKKMTNEMHARFPKDDVVLRAKKRISLATNQIPVWVISEVGMHMFKYYKQINERDEKFFLENDYDAEMAHTLEVNPESAKLSAYLMPKIKETWAETSKEEQEDYYTRIYELLVGFIEYCVLKD
jgi:hypothetical protein